MKQIKTTAVIAVLACAGLTACASVDVGGAPMALSPAMAEQARIGTVTTTTGWLDAEDDFADTFNDEVLNEMGLCAGGRHRLNLSIHVEALSRAPRLAILAGDRAEHRMRATAELRDPAQGGQVVGRYPLVVTVDAGAGVLDALMDRQAVTSHAFAQALCDAAFVAPTRVAEAGAPG